MKLYTYFRSTAAYRVRIALNLKGLQADYRYVHLVKDGGQQHQPDYRKVNPQGLVPALEDKGQVLTQSLAIIEYLEEVHPNPPLLPKDSPGRARVRALAQIVACDIHPLNNLRVLKYLEKELATDDAAREQWYHHWVVEGFTALENLLASNPATGEFCHGNTPSLADICLVPQVFNAKRFSVDLSAYPTIQRINSRCLALKAFSDAAPEKQADAQ
ncbi:MAG: maleylacetoacetate isomerase [Gammaproteobacteria bacterium]|nr:maleylacetoacetate isomerase [Gammaproteobacteria bacterium]MDE2346173.1 maleylacetoacetate isomerase [Gammaproteobacteria bacterium]